MSSPMTPAQVARDFQERFGGVIRHEPTVPEPWERDVLIEIMAEELLELICAMHGTAPKPGAVRRVLAALLAEAQPAGGQVGRVDLHDVMLELADLLIISSSVGDHYGFDSEHAVRVKHESNLSKLDADGSPVRSPSGKVLKGPYFQAPDRSKLPAVPAADR